MLSFVFVHYILAHEPWHGLKKRFSGAILASEQEAGEIAAAPSNERSKPALQFEPRFYVGEIAVSTAKLAEELHFEIAIRVFNASNAHIDISKIRGHISCGKSSSGTFTPIVDLPPPRLEDRGRTENIAPYEEAFVILEQRVPQSIAEAIQNVSASERIQLNFGNLNVLVTPRASQDQVVRLPLWSGLSLYRRADKILVARVVVGHVALRAGAATAGDAGST